jgi:hypothetical protein
MSLLNNITRGTPSNQGIRMVVAGVEKIGKTTLACGAPNTLLIPLEVGFAGITIDKVPLVHNYQTLIQLVTEIVGYAQSGQFPYKTISFDSVTAIERLIHAYVISLDPSARYNPATGKCDNKSATLESVHGGFAKGQAMANDLFKDLLEIFDNLAIYAGINIIMTAHVFSSVVKDPTVGEFNCWDLLLHSPKNEKTYGKRELLTQWADVVSFLYEPLMLLEGSGDSINRGVSQNKGRVLGISRTPAYVAGNRFGMQNEIPIKAPPANGWNCFAEELLKTSGIDVLNKQV